MCGRLFTYSPLHWTGEFHCAVCTLRSCKFWSIAIIHLNFRLYLRWPLRNCSIVEMHFFVISFNDDDDNNNNNNSIVVGGIDFPKCIYCFAKLCVATICLVASIPIPTHYMRRLNFSIDSFGSTHRIYAMRTRFSVYANKYYECIKLIYGLSIIRYPHGILYQECKWIWRRRSIKNEDKAKKNRKWNTTYYDS